MLMTCSPLRIRFAYLADGPELTQNRLPESRGVLDIKSGKSVFIIAEIVFPL